MWLVKFPSCGRVIPISIAPGLGHRNTPSVADAAAIGRKSWRWERESFPPNSAQHQPDMLLDDLSHSESGC